MSLKESIVRHKRLIPIVVTVFAIAAFMVSAQTGTFNGHVVGAQTTTVTGGNGGIGGAGGAGGTAGGGGLNLANGLGSFNIANGGSANGGHGGNANGGGACLAGVLCTVAPGSIR